MFYITFIDFINKTNSYGICSNMCLFIYFVSHRFYVIRSSYLRFYLINVESI